MDIIENLSTIFFYFFIITPKFLNRFIDIDIKLTVKYWGWGNGELLTRNGEFIHNTNTSKVNIVFNLIENKICSLQEGKNVFGVCDRRQILNGRKDTDDPYRIFEILLT